MAVDSHAGEYCGTNGSGVVAVAAFLTSYQAAELVRLFVSWFVSGCPIIVPGVFR